MKIQQALNILDAGETLITGRTLLRKNDDTILASSGSWTARMSLDDFLSLYRNCEFEVRQSPAAIDETADLQYYGKLRARQ